MYEQDKANAAKTASDNGYKQSAYDSTKWIKDGKTATIKDNSINVNGTTYSNSSDAKKSSKW